jgi:hypothetical protein
MSLYKFLYLQLGPFLIQISLFYFLFNLLTQNLYNFSTVTPI